MDNHTRNSTVLQILVFLFLSLFFIIDSNGQNTISGFYLDRSQTVCAGCEMAIEFVDDSTFFYHYETSWSYRYTCGFYKVKGNMVLLHPKVGGMENRKVRILNNGESVKLGRNVLLKTPCLHVPAYLKIDSLNCNYGDVSIMSDYAFYSQALKKWWHHFNNCKDNYSELFFADGIKFYESVIDDNCLCYPFKGTDNIVVLIKIYEAAIVYYDNLNSPTAEAYRARVENLKIKMKGTGL